MLKYTLRIEGTAEEIEMAKGMPVFISHNKTEWGSNAFLPLNTALPLEVEYITREPKIASSQCEHCGQQLPKEVLRYRVKTLVELVQEFGEEVEIVSDLESDERELLIRTYEVPVRYLGKPWTILLSDSHQEWKKIFLKQID